MATIEKFIESYTEWLKSNINLKKIDEWIEISTPFLDNHNDHLNIFVKSLENNRYLLTDDGYVISDLMMSGCDIETTKRKEILELTINRLGITLEDDSLMVEATPENFAQKKHMLLQAMMSVSDMFMLSRSKIVNIFLEEIEHYFDLKEISYLSSIQLNGISGFTHSFDFAIPKSKNKPERLLKAINNPSKTQAESALFTWDDVRKTRNSDSKFIVLLNDIEKPLNNNVINAFKIYGVSTIPWSNKEDHLNELTA